MSSPVVINKPFSLGKNRVTLTDVFVNLGHRKGNKGITDVLFLKRQLPSSDNVTVGDYVSLTGFCGYRYLHQGTRIFGVIFEAFSLRCDCKQYQLTVSSPGASSGQFDLLFDLENVGILAFKSEDSSILLIPKSTPENAFLVKDTPNGT